MSSYHERFSQAHRHAVAAGEAAYERAPQGEKWAAYHQTYRREIVAFDELEALRRPHPRQAEIDAESAALLRNTRPECERPIPASRCEHCNGDGGV